MVRPASVAKVADSGQNIGVKRFSLSIFSSSVGVGAWWPCPISRSLYCPFVSCSVDSQEAEVSKSCNKWREEGRDGVFQLFYAFTVTTNAQFKVWSWVIFDSWASKSTKNHHEFIHVHSNKPSSFWRLFPSCVLGAKKTNLNKNGCQVLNC